MAEYEAWNEEWINNHNNLIGRSYSLYLDATRFILLILLWFVIFAYIFSIFHCELYEKYVMNFFFVYHFVFAITSKQQIEKDLENMLI